MSMYTRLLDAAYEQRAAQAGASANAAIDEARRRRGALAGETRHDVDDPVPLVLALELGYDMALLELARLLGIDSDPSRFELPHHERDRLEHALRDRGISLEAPGGAGVA
jgi:hypothetical protein